MRWKCSGYFAKEVLPKITKPFTIVSGRFDYFRRSLDNVRVILESPFLDRWLAPDILFVHRKLFSIPVGIRREGAACGCPQTLEAVMAKGIVKSTIVHAQYAMRNVRKICASETIAPLPKVHLLPYYEAVARSFFEISPPGTGEDCHRHWESLYLRTIPIVIDNESLNMRFFDRFPLVRLKRWSDFKSLPLGEDFYNKVWNRFDLNELDVDRLLDRMVTMAHPLIGPATCGKV